MKLPYILFLSIAACRLASCTRELPTAPVADARIRRGEGVAPARRHSVPRIREVAPLCSAPAPLIKATCPGPGYLVRLQEGSDVPAVTASLEKKYNFKATYVLTVNPVFVATLNLQTVAALRCEPQVAKIEENAILTIGPVPSPCS